MDDETLLPLAIEAYDGDQTSLEIHWLDPELEPADRSTMWAILSVSGEEARIDSYGYVSREEAESLIRFPGPVDDACMLARDTQRQSLSPRRHLSRSLSGLHLA